MIANENIFLGVNVKIHFLKTKWSDIIILEHLGKFALVDTGFEEQFEQLSAYLQKLGAAEIEFILLTHFHRDHYGCIPKLVRNYKVKTVYLKEYSGLDSTTAWGTPADNAYRNEEMKKYTEMQRCVSKFSVLKQVEDTKNIEFAGILLQLFATDNSMRYIYEDATYPETYHKICFVENQNSIGVFFKTGGKNVFLGGDLTDSEAPHPKANYVVRKIAESIGEQIDVYKVPHHGTVFTGCPEALSIFRPKMAIITNEDAYLRQNSDVYENLKRANEQVEILLTENKDIVVNLE